MNALDLLIADHNRVRGMFARFKTAQEASDTAQMVELAEKLFDDLDVHTTIEEEIFYPGVREADDETAATIDEGIQEHHVAKVLMEEIRGVEAGSDDWVAKMTVLIENVEHHAEEEETDLFPSIRRPLASLLDDMTEQLEQRKSELGAPVLADKIDLTKERLLDLAQAQEIPGRSTMTHDELAATVAPD